MIKIRFNQEFQSSTRGEILNIIDTLGEVFEPEGENPYALVFEEDLSEIREAIEEVNSNWGAHYSFSIERRPK